MNLNPTANSYTNLKFLFFEIKNGNPNQIKESTLLEKGNYTAIQLVDNFTFVPNEERMYELVFYIENKPNEDQTLLDAGKEFGAGISINSVTTGAYIAKQYGSTCWNDEPVINENNEVIGHRLVSFNGINNIMTLDEDENVIYDENYGKINESCTGYVEDIDGDTFYEVKIPSKFNNHDITHLGNQLLTAADLNTFTPNNYTKIESIIVEDGIKVLEDGVIEENLIYGGFTSFGANPFTHEIIVDDFNLKLPNTLEYIGTSYMWVNALETLDIPSSVKTIGIYAIGSGSKLTTLKFGVDAEGKSNLNSIGQNAFSNNSLNYPVGNPLIIPSSVTFIGSGAFSSNLNLLQIKYSGDTQGFEDYWNGNAEVIK